MRNFIIPFIYAFSILLLSNNISFGQHIIPGFTPKIKKRPRINSHFVQSDNKIILGGFFTFSGDSEIKHVVRLNPDGSWDDSFKLDPSIPYDQVLHIFQSKNDKIVVLSHRNGMNVLEKDGTLDPSFAYPDDVFTNPFAVPVDDGYIIYTYERNLQYHGIFKINLDGSVNTEFNPIKVVNIDGIAITPENKILVFGSFNSVNDTDQAYLAKFAQNGTLDETFIPEFDGPVYDAVPLNDGSILVGGSFTRFGDVTNKYFLKLTGDGSLDESFTIDEYNEVFNSYPFEVFVDGDKFLVLSFQGSNQRNRLVRFDSNGEIDSTFNIFEYEIDRNYITVSTFNNGYLMTGDLEYLYESTELFGIIAIQNDGMKSNEFNHEVRDIGEVRKSVITMDSKYLLSGEISGVDHQNSKQLILMHPDGSLDLDFDNNLPLGLRDQITNIHELPNGQLLISGLFYDTGLPDGTIKQLLRIDPDGTLDESFNVNVGQIHSLTKIEDFVVLPDGSIVIAGEFNGINATQIENIAKLSDDGELDMGFNSQGLYADYHFKKIDTLNDGSLIVGGRYSDEDGRDFAVLASLDDTGNPDLSKFGVIEDFPLQAQNFDIYDSVLVITGNQCCDQFSPVVLMNTNDWTYDDSSISFYRYGNTWDSFGVNDSTLLIGGSFSLVNDFESDALVGISFEGVVNENLVYTVEGFYFEGLSPAIHTITEISEDTVLISGIFTGINDVDVYSLAKLKYKINYGPIIEADTSLTLDEDNALVLNEAWVTGSDPENDPVEIIFLEGENYSIANGSLIPELNFNGILFLKVVGFDGEKYSEEKTIPITIIPVNDPPSVLNQIRTLELQAGIENEVSVDAFEISDPDDSQFTLEIVSVDENYVANGNNITPGEDVLGEINFQIVVSDGKESSSPFDVIANVNPVLGVTKDLVTIYPNPFDKYLKVVVNHGFVDNYHLEVRRLDGKLIVKEKVMGESYIYLPGLESGLYIILLEGDFGREMYKMVKR